MMKERDIILKVKQGDKTAFSLLYTRYWKQVYGFTCLYIHSVDDAEEIVQEVFIRLWEHRSVLDEEKKPDGMLFIMTRNLIFNRYRKSLNEQFLIETIASAWDIADGAVAEEVETEDLRQYIRTLVEMLPQRQQEVFHLSRNEGLSYKEIAEKLHITPKTVERHINEVLKQLRRKLKSDLK
ncbi:MAG: RNA polymerase sigma-70 factor [Bacteroides sp.]|nr:RNA polymerase sigma-70 factor [Bacteroides sp.]